jgi:hypothetical protein
MSETRHRVIAPALALAIIAISLAGCDSTQDGDPSPPDPPSPPIANFSDVTGKVPYPFDFYFTGSADGTLNIPAAVTWHPLSPALNALDGWSTNAPIDTSFNAPIDPATVNGTSVKVLKLWVDYTTKAPCQSASCLPAGATSPVAGVLTYGTDFIAEVDSSIDSDGKFLRIVPLKPLAASKGPAANSGGPDAGKILNVGYVVFITDDLKATDGQAFAADAVYASVKPPASCATLEVKYQGLCAITQGHLGIANAVAGVNPAKVIVSWWFSTQSVDDVMAVTTASATAQPTLAVPTGLTTSVVSPNFGGADIYVGSTQLPYYLTRPANANDAASVLTKNWTGVGGSNLTMFNPTPVIPTGQAATLTVPLLVTIPNAAACPTGKPATGWPVVVFQHGITGSRTNALGIADSYARACIAVAAIDLPLHGITDTTSPFYCTPDKPQCLGATERTFDIDIMNNTTGAAGPDGRIDPSGGVNGLTYYNFFNPLVFRDNLRQSSVDMGQLTKSITGLAIPTPTGLVPVGIDATQVHFTGHSQGAISGAPHVKFSSGIQTAVLANPGGPISLIAQDESGRFGQVAKSLVSARAPAYTYNYFMVFRDVQAVLDAGDPYNHIKGAAARHPVLLFEVLGDTTVTNAATESLIAAAGLEKVTTLGPNPVGPGAYTVFSQGGHSSLLDWINQPVTLEMQMQAAYFAATAVVPGGPFVTLTNPAVLDLN